MSFGGGGQKDAIKHQNEQIKKKWEYDKKNYEYQWGVDANTIGEDGEGGSQQFNADGTKKGAAWDDYQFNVEAFEKRKASDQESRQYQQDTAQQNWEMGVAAQDYEWDKQDEIYKQNQEQYANSIAYNQREYNDALERETLVLEEQFLQSAFENQGMIADLYEATGSAGFDQASQKLGLLKQEDLIESQKQKQLINLKQQTEGSKYQKAGTELSMLDASGKSQFEQASLVQGLGAQEADRRFQKAFVIMDDKQKEVATQYQNEMIRRQTRQTYAKAAQEGQEQIIASLKQQGQAQLTQSGRSQGKAVQMVMAELGRQNAYLANSLMHGTGIAEAQSKFNAKSMLSNKAKAGLQLDKLQNDSKTGLEKTLLNLEEVDRNLKLGNARGELSLDQIKKQVFDNVENTALDVKTLENNLLHAQTRTGLDLKKIDWDIDNLGSRFKTNQDIMKATLDSAVEASALNRKDILRGREKADLDAEALRMLDPSIGRDAVDLENFKPLDLPMVEWQAPQEPKLPPAPIKGAMQDTSIGASGFAAAAAQGVVTGAALWAVNPVVGAIAGTLSFLSGL
tara:strand:+ start:101 stop:1801 length:1701 start_codon:yes stop_codon:yes gene_type:complete